RNSRTAAANSFGHSRTFHLLADHSAVVRSRRAKTKSKVPKSGSRIISFGIGAIRKVAIDNFLFRASAGLVQHVERFSVRFGLRFCATDHIDVFARLVLTAGNGDKTGRIRRRKNARLSNAVLASPAHIAQRELASLGRGPVIFPAFGGSRSKIGHVRPNAGGVVADCHRVPGGYSRSVREKRQKTN